MVGLSLIDSAEGDLSLGPQKDYFHLAQLVNFLIAPKTEHGCFVEIPIGMLMCH